MKRELKHNVSSIKNCFGCGVCASSCPQKIVDITINKNGFYEPSIKNQDSCINCSICLDVCSFNHNGTSVNNSPLQSWGSWSNDEAIRRKCSSGGIGFEILRQLQFKGYTIIACRYNADLQIAEHFTPKDELELIESIGSKYIQSYTPDALRQIKREGKYAIIGTPCQIDSIRRMIKRFKMEDNFILVDFFCHCVPSLNAWRQYLRMVEKKIGKTTYASWRNKYHYGWHDSWIMCLDNQAPPKLKLDWKDSYNLYIKEKKGKWMSRKSMGDLFYTLFLGDIAMNPACSKNCKFKYDKSSADIRIGDAWGHTYQKDEEGVSALVGMTRKGVEIIESLTNITLQAHDFETIAEGQMRTNAIPKLCTTIVLILLRKRVPIDSLLFSSVLFMQKVLSKLHSIIKK